jgi:hypothetical protein
VDVTAGSPAAGCPHGARLPPTTIEAASLPDDVLALLEHHPLGRGGTYGTPQGADLTARASGHANVVTECFAARAKGGYTPATPGLADPGGQSRMDLVK